VIGSSVRKDFVILLILEDIIPGTLTTLEVEITFLPLLRKIL
jgi:hypothetical protein